jgi:hypothetical protein
MGLFYVRAFKDLPCVHSKTKTSGFKQSAIGNQLSARTVNIEVGLPFAHILNEMGP